MLTPSNLTTIKWAGSNTVMIELERNSARLYLTKNEALDIIAAVTMFVEAYPEDFTMDKLDNVDTVDDKWDWTSTYG